MRCSKCGKKLKNDASFCTYCGNKLAVNIQETDKITKKHIKSSVQRHLTIAIIVIGLIFYFFSFRCKSGLCPLPSVFNGDYCVIHTCDRTECINKKAADEKYCYTHLPSTSTHYNYTPEIAEDVLAFSDIQLSHNSSYTVCNGTITNNGERTYTFVEIKGKFKDSSGTTLDTDWTYAVGSEGLAPGESATFRMSVKKNNSIKSCSVEILDYDKK